MTALRWVSALAALVPVLLASPRAQADPEREKYELGVVALKNKDCPTAADAFNSVQGPLREDPGFVNYAAEANECAGNLAKALEYYRQKEAFDQDKLKAQQKIGELLYRMQKEKTAAPVATPTPAVQDDRQSVKFVVGNSAQHFGLEVDNADGMVSCEEVTFVKPCTLQIRSGPARIRVNRGASFTADVQIPDSACTVTLTHDDRHGILLSGLITLGGGVVLLGVGSQIPNTNEDPAGLILDIYGGVGVVIGLVLVIVDVARTRDDTAKVTAHPSAELHPDFSPRLVGAAPFTDGRRGGAALVFEF